MNNFLKSYTLFLFLSIGSHLFAQNNVVSGYITDCKTGEKLIGVQIKDGKSGKTTSSNSFGFYSLSAADPDSIIIYLNYIGYQNKKVWLKPKDKNQDIALCEGDYTISQVEITGNRFSDITQSNVLSIPMKEIKSLPSILGEVDVLRAYMLMPGVQGGKEGTSELYVRGGSPDQNLIILDDIPLYYINHMGGFVSIFDNSALQTVDLFKGGFPARYGGRLSAVTDIRMRDGNMHKMSGEVSLGIISAKIRLEGPVIRDKSSFLITVRRSIFDLFLRPLSNKSSGGKISAGYTFYDLNAKYQHKLSEKDRVFLSIYSGRDRLFLNSKQEDAENTYKGKDYIYWGNILAALRWNHQYSPRLFMNITGAYTNFGYHTDYDFVKKSLDGGEESHYKNTYKSQVYDFIFKSDFDFFANETHKIKFGQHAIYHTYKPGVASFEKVSGQQTDIDTTFGSKTLNSYEFDSYLEDEIKLGEHFSANIGFHYSAFLIEDTWFQSVQPRIMALCEIAKSFSLKASYSKMSQNIHLLTNSNSGQPTDLWVPATKLLKPENSTQYTFGFNSAVYENKIEFGIDAFYKEMDNLIDYKEGASFFSSSKDWQEKVETGGTGLVYGLEFLLRKRTGQTTGWIAYTLSKNERTFENLNFGNPFPYKYDSRHDISIVMTHQFNKRVTISASWTFNTGYHLTLAEGKYNLVTEGASGSREIPKNTVLPMYLNYNYAYIYGGKNKFQTNNYHRLDVSCSFTKKLKRGTRVWNISIYNLYNHLNPYYIYYKMEDEQLKLYQYSLFPIMPSFSYSFSF